MYVYMHLRGMPAGMTIMSAPVKAFFMPSSLGRKPSTFCTLRFSSVPGDVRGQGAATGNTHGGCGDVRKIGCDTGCVDNIIEREVVDQGRRLEEEREGLANTAGCTCDDCGVVDVQVSDCACVSVRLPRPASTYQLSYLRLSGWKRVS